MELVLVIIEQLFLLHLIGTFLISNADESGNHWSRVRRSPDSERIQRWKLAFSGDLAPLPRVLPAVTCNWALHELCLKHVSCRELWTLFRRNCLVDAQNNCMMNNKNDCWQSFEGISWTGLGSCNCPGNNSDCHWIRLQTNYNKCIYLLNNDANWHTELNTPAQFYANRGLATQTHHLHHHFNPNGEMQEAGVNKWKAEQWDWQWKQQQKARIAEEERRALALEEAQHSRQIEEERRRKAIELEQERQRRVREEEEQRKNKMKEEEEEEKKRKLEEVRIQEEHLRLRKAHAERMERIKAEEERRRRILTEDERKKRQEEEEEARMKQQKQKQMKSNERRHQIIQIEEPGKAQQKTISDGQIRVNSSSSNMTTPTLVATTQQRSSERTTVSNGNGRNVYHTVSTADTKRTSSTKARQKSPTTTITLERIQPTAESQQLMTQVETPPTTNVTSEIMENPHLMNMTTSGNVDKKPVPIGTCPEVLTICEKDEAACKWHLSELIIKCPTNATGATNYCQRSVQCSAALSRFVRFVPGPLAEAMLFCSPAGENPNELPNVLHHNQINCSAPLPGKKPKARWSCMQTAQMCRAEPNCNRRLNTLRSACTFTFPNATNNNSALAPSSPPSCTAPSLARCRTALATIRGSWLDEPCHCSSRGDSQKECRRWEATLWQQNPCIEKVQDDFNELFLAGQLQIEPTTKSPKKFKAETMKNQSSSLMELGEEVTLLPSEDEEQKNITNARRTEGKSRERLKQNRTGQQQMQKKGSGTKATAPTTTRTSSTTTTTAIPTTTEGTILEEWTSESLNAEEVQDNDAGIIGQQNSSRLSYQFAKDDPKMATNATNEQFISSKETIAAIALSEVNTSTLLDDDFAGNKRTTGRQPLPEYEFITQRPPSEGDGCRTRNIDGEWIEHYPDSIFRYFHDWAGRCSSWCECSSNSTTQCHPLGCLPDVLCEARHTTVGFGQRLYLEDRGACQCHDGRFICDSSELQPELGPGLYISLGYSKAELEMIRQKVPKQVLERSGLISQSASLVKDLATRLQFALERVLPEGMKCRVAVLEHFPPEQVVLMQLQWFGVDPSVNQSRPKWHSGKMEKHCSIYVRELEINFMLEKADRYQLILSAIKQIRVIDMLDALPPNSGSKQLKIPSISIFAATLAITLWMTTKMYALMRISR